MKINEDQNTLTQKTKSTKLNENQRKSMKINENLKTHTHKTKSTKLNENQ